MGKTPETTPKLDVPALSAEERATLAEPMASDDDALREAAELSQNLPEDDLRKRARHAEHRRAENFKDHFECIAIVGLWALAAGILAFGFTWFWHIISPPYWHWLDAEHVARIQNIFTGGVLAGVVADQFRRRLG